MSTDECPNAQTGDTIPYALPVRDESELALYELLPKLSEETIGRMLLGIPDGQPFDPSMLRYRRPAPDAVIDP